MNRPFPREFATGSHLLRVRAGWAAYIRLLAAVVESSRRYAFAVAGGALGLTVLLLVYTAQNLGLQTDTADMLARDLPFRGIYNEFKEAFPQFSDTILIVVEGETIDSTDDAAELLAGRLRERGEAFEFVYRPDGDPFFVRNGLLYLDDEDLTDLIDRLAEAQPLLASLAEDMTLRGLFGVLGDAVDEAAKGERSLEDLNRAFRRLGETVEARLAGRPRPLSWQELIADEDPAPSDLRRFILAKPRIEHDTLAPGAEAMALIRGDAADLGLADGGVKVRLTGGEALDTEELQSVMRWAGIASLLSFLLVTALLVVGLRSIRLVASTLITLFCGLVWTAAFATLAIGHLNLISVAFAVLFIGLSVDFGIHFSLRYKEEVDRGEDHGEALSRATEGIGGALTLCAGAAAIGFYAFLPTDYAGLAELGLIAGTGMFIALLANLTLLPALLTLLPPRPSPMKESRWLGFDPGVVLRERARAILFAAAALAVGAVVLLPFARFDFNPLRLKDPSAESVQTYFDLLADSDTSPYTISILAENGDEAVKLADRLEALQEVDKAVTLRSFVPENQEEKLDLIDQTSLILFTVLNPEAVPPPPPGTRRMALGALRAKLDTLLAAYSTGGGGEAVRCFAASLDGYADAFGLSESALADLEGDLLVSLPGRLEKLRLAFTAAGVAEKDLPADLRERFLASGGKARVEVFPTENIADNEALRRFVHAVRKVAPNATDTPVLLVEAERAVMESFLEAGVVAFVVIAVFLLVLLQSLRDVGFVFVPIALAGALTIATTVLLGLPFNFANVIVFPLLFGLGVASGIHLVLRQRAEVLVLQSLRTSTPRAVVFSALTTIGSFASLAISTHRGIASMGELLTVAIAFTLICSLFVLPALMAGLPQSWSEKG